ncbi:hypothetical protein BU15DRAFT_79519 [Melanogaster broomeanus]|nr:hypothetical protein BU15DRAFT_79519 [Melanogaster broomeanus]
MNTHSPSRGSTTLSTPASASGTAYRDRTHATTTLANPYFPNMPAQLPGLSKDFHLDTFFNPGLDVGSARLFLCQGWHGRYQARQPLRPTNRLMTGQRGVVPSTSKDTTHKTSQRLAAAATRSYAAAVKASLFNGLSNTEKPWKNVAITEHDDAEFEGIKAAALENKEIAQQHPKFPQELEQTREALEVQLVHTLPPALPVYLQIEQLVNEYESVSGDENEAPELSYSASPVMSQASEPEESPDIPTPEQRGDRRPFQVLHEETVPFEEEPLEKVVGFERLRRKAPPPLHLNENGGVNEDDGGYFLFENIGLMNEREEKRVLSPLTAGIPVQSKLSATLVRT